MPARIARTTAAAACVAAVSVTGMGAAGATPAHRKLLPTHSNAPSRTAPSSGSQPKRSSRAVASMTGQTSPAGRSPNAETGPAGTVNGNGRNPHAEVTSTSFSAAVAAATAPSAPAAVVFTGTADGSLAARSILGPGLRSAHVSWPISLEVPVTADAALQATPPLRITTKPSGAADSSVVHAIEAVGRAAPRTFAFPGALAVVTVVFLFGQELIDRREPKLAARRSDEQVGFSPPPTSPKRS